MLLPLLLSVPLASPAAPGDDAAHAYRLDVRVSPIVDLYCELRVLAADPSALSVDDPRAPAVAAIRALDRELGPLFLGWGLVEGGLAEAHSGADLAAAFGALPESWELRDGRSIALRAPALAIAAEIAALEPAWRRDVWPERLAELMDAATRLRAAVESRPEALSDFAAAMELAPAGAVVPVLLVSDATAPGAFTYRRPGGGGLCFVGVRAHPGSQLLETALHESLHALEVQLGDDPSLLTKLRDALTAAGLGERDPALRNVPHTLYFLHAADTVRRHFDPEHEDYGDVASYYEKVAPVAEYERPLWEAYRSGELDADALVAQLVEAALAAR